MNSEGFFVAIMVIVVAAVVIGIAVMYLLTMQNLLKAIAPQNRTTEPGNVWLMLIPLFNLVYQFILVGHVADSIVNELNSRNEPLGSDPRPTYQLGLWKCITGVSGIIPILGPLASLASFILWIIYWVKLAEWKNWFLKNPYNQSGFQNEGLLDS